MMYVKKAILIKIILKYNKCSFDSNSLVIVKVVAMLITIKIKCATVAAYCQQ